jgi:hypothetical protein
MPPTRRPADRARLLDLVERLLGDERMRARTLTDEDLARIVAILSSMAPSTRWRMLLVPGRRLRETHYGQGQGE